MRHAAFARLLLCVALAAGCGHEVSADNQAVDVHRDTVDKPSGVAVPLEDLLPSAAAVPTALEGTAILFSDLDAEIAPQMNGVVVAVTAELGDVVKAGQLLARLDDQRQLARVASNTSARDLAEADFARAEGLLASGFVTPAEHDQARYRLGMTAAALREAEVELALTRIVAPFDGVVTRRMTGVGRAVTEGEPLFRVTTLQPLRALVRIPEADARAIRRGLPALLVGGDSTAVDAIVARVSPAVDPASGTVEVLLDVPRPGSLRPGSAALVQFPSLRDRVP